MARGVIQGVSRDDHKTQANKIVYNVVENVIELVLLLVLLLVLPLLLAVDLMGLTKEVHFTWKRVMVAFMMVFMVLPLVVYVPSWVSQARQCQWL